VLEAADVPAGAQVVDLGCGTGQISLPLALRGAEVLAVDVSSAMVRRLRSEARRRSASGLEGLALPIEELVLPPGSVDLVVSSYALHHLRDPDKARLVSAAYGWLRPGGRLVVADMMFGRGTSRRDRAIIRSKVAALARKGPGGWWRIAKNAARYLVRVQERPLPARAWTAMLTGSGFVGVTATEIVAEAAIVAGQRPENHVPAGGRSTRMWRSSLTLRMPRLRGCWPGRRPAPTWSSWDGTAPTTHCSRARARPSKRC